jgi:hypothetical protein
MNVARLQNTALRQIKRWGGQGFLVRDGAKRACWVCIIDYKPRDADLRMVGAKRALIAAKGLAVGPDRELDQVEFKGQRWRIVNPITGPRPNGTPIFYDCEVVYESAAT